MLTASVWASLFIYKPRKKKLLSFRRRQLGGQSVSLAAGKQSIGFRLFFPFTKTLYEDNYIPILTTGDFVLCLPASRLRSPRLG